MGANTRQICAVLMAHHGEGYTKAPPDVLDQIPNDMPIDIIGGDGAYAAKSRRAPLAILLREGQCLDLTQRAVRRNAAIDAVAKSSRREWRKKSGYHRSLLEETTIYQLKMLAGQCLSVRGVGLQATEVSIHACIQPNVVSSS